MDRHTGELVVSGGGWGEAERRGAGETGHVEWGGIGLGEGYPQHLGFESRLVLPECAASDNQFTPAVTLPVFNTGRPHPPHWRVTVIEAKGLALYKCSLTEQTWALPEPKQA